MKTAAPNWILFVGLVCLATLQAKADGPNREGNRPDREDVVAKFDANGDGRLDSDERKAAGAARAATRQESAAVDEDASGKSGHHGGARGANGKGAGRGKGKGKGANGHGGPRGANGHGGPRGANGHGGAKRANGASAEQAPDGDAAQVRDDARTALPGDGKELQDEEGDVRERKGRGPRPGKNGKGHARGRARRDGSVQER